MPSVRKLNTSDGSHSALNRSNGNLGDAHRGKSRFAPGSSVASANVSKLAPAAQRRLADKLEQRRDSSKSNLTAQQQMTLRALKAPVGVAKRTLKGATTSSNPKGKTKYSKQQDYIRNIFR